MKQFLLNIQTSSPLFLGFTDVNFKMSPHLSKIFICAVRLQVAPLFTVHGAALGFVWRWLHQLFSLRRDLKFTKEKKLAISILGRTFPLKKPKMIRGHLRIQRQTSLCSVMQTLSQHFVSSDSDTYSATTHINTHVQFLCPLPHFPFPLSVFPKAGQNNSPPVCPCLCQLPWPEGLLWHPVLGS